MKKWSFLLLLLSLCVPAFAQYLGHTNNGSLTENLWWNGSWINCNRQLATTNLTVTNILAQVKATSGKYKCAIYSGDINAPITLLRGSYEVVNPASDGWYSFPLTNAVTLTNSQYYWFVIWSDSTTAASFYNAGPGTLAWAQYDYGAWPNPYVATGAAPGQDYCIYVTNVVSAPTNPPQPYVLARVTVAWDASPDATVTGYNFYYGVATRNYTNMINVGNALQVTVSNLVVGVTYYFAATAYNALGTESIFSDELVYTIPAYNPQLRSLTLNPTNVIGSNSVQGLVVLTERVLTNALIALTHNNTNAIAALPTNATVLVGNSNATFIITTRTVTLTNQVNVLATFRGSTLTNVLTVRPATVVPTVPTTPLNFQFSPKP